MTTTTKARELERFIDSLGFRYIKGREFTPYWARVRRGVKNGVPPEALWPNIIKTAAVLDRFRHEFGAPVILDSTYRRRAYNIAVGGAPGSFHLEFRAIDFHCVGPKRGTPEQWARRLEDLRGVEITLPGNRDRFHFAGGVGLYPTFVHVDTRGHDFSW